MPSICARMNSNTSTGERIPLSMHNTPKRLLEAAPFFLDLFQLFGLEGAEFLQIVSQAVAAVRRAGMNDISIADKDPFDDILVFGLDDSRNAKPIDGVEHLRQWSLC